MVKGFKELVKNVNFDLRLAECIVCLVATILSFVSYIAKDVLDNKSSSTTVEGPYPWPVHGWFVISLTFLVAYVLEQPNFGLELLLIVIYYVLMVSLLPYWSFSTRYVCVAITALLMLADLIVLISNKDE